MPSRSGLLSPSFEENRVQIRIFKVVTSVYILAPVVGELANFFVEKKISDSFISSSFIAIFGISVFLWYQKTKKIRHALIANSIGQLIFFSWGLLATQGIRADHFIYLSAFIVVNGFFLGRVGAFCTTLYAIALTFCLGYLEYISYLPFAISPLPLAIVQTVACLVFVGWIIDSYESERRASERALKTHLNATKQISEAKEIILEGAGLGSWDWYLESNDVNFDNRWLAMIGLEPGQVSQTLETWESRVHPEDIEKCRQDIRSYLDGHKSIYENIHRMKHTNGSWIWILDRGKISERDANGRPLRFTGIHFNISAYKDFEMLSQEIQQMANIGGWELDLVSSKMRWTDQTYHIFSFNPSESIDITKFTSSFAGHKGKIETAIQRCKEALPFHDTFEFLDATGKTKWVECSGEPVKNANGTVVKLRGTLQDVTEKHQLQMSLEHEKLVALQSAKMASLGEMSAGIAHEINNPLAILNGAIPLLEKGREDKDKFAGKIVTIIKATERITRIVNGLRKFSRSSQTSTHKSETLNSIIQEALVIVNAKSTRYFTPIRIVEQSECKISCDAVEIEQVLINLINNAIDAVKDVEVKWVELVLFKESGDVVLQVIDSGRGIAKETEDRLFQPFFTTKKVGEGTGLGLSISKGILDQHNATIFLNKKIANTCFELRFPSLESAQLSTT